MYAKRQHRYRKRLHALRKRLDAGDAQINLLSNAICRRNELALPTSTSMRDLVQRADSDDCGRAIQLNLATRSDRGQPPVPMKATGTPLPACSVGSGFLGGVKVGDLGGDLS